jgi:hypothetical protein
MSDHDKPKDDDTTTTTTNKNAPVKNHFLFPAVTEDYRLTKGKFGYQLVANRRIKKGSVVLADSLEFLFSDVQDGDCLWFSANHEEETSSKLPSGAGGTEIPAYHPITRHMLTQTHGLYEIQKQSSEEVVLSCYLEVPGMMMNHSCDPSTFVNKNGVDIAARDLQVGDELTVDYAGGDYDETPVEDCSCGAANCRGKAIAFNHIKNKAEQERLFSQIMPATRAQYLSALGKGPRVRDEQIVHPPRTTTPLPSASSTIMNRKVMRLVCPGPCADDTKIMVKKCINDENFNGASVDSIHEYGLYAAQDFSKGQMLYYFWSQGWPQFEGDEEAVIDMAFATPEQDEGDDKEGTVIRFDPLTCGAYRNVNGQLTFSAWQLLAAHSCDPNTVYRNKEKFEGDNWQRVVAAKDIKKGDRLSVDWNCFIWDLNIDSTGTRSCDAVCHCGVRTCTGKKQGFKHLSSKDQQERLEMTWLHEAPSASDSNNGSSMLNRALSPFVREAWKKVGGPEEDQTQERFQ